MFVPSVNSNQQEAPKAKPVGPHSCPLRLHFLSQQTETSPHLHSPEGQQSERAAESQGPGLS